MNADELLSEFKGFLPSDDNKFIVCFTSDLGYIAVYNDEETKGYYEVVWDDGFGNGDDKKFKDVNKTRNYVKSVRRILKISC